MAGSQIDKDTAGGYCWSEYITLFLNRGICGRVYKQESILLEPIGEVCMLINVYSSV